MPESEALSRILEQRRTTAREIVQQIDQGLQLGWVYPPPARCVLAGCADMQRITRMLTEAWEEIERMASYAAFCRKQDELKRRLHNASN